MFYSCQSTGLMLTEKIDGTTSRINVLSFARELVVCDEIGK
jgi:hypothetical protein